MSVQNEIDRISGNVSDTMDALNEYGVDTTGANSDDMAGLVRAIPKATVVQATGESTTDVMSQAAVTRELDKLTNEIADQTAIIDVVELPTEGIKEDVFYRLLTGTWVFDQFVQNHMVCHCVKVLPDTGEPAVSGDLSNLDNSTITTYYNVSDESVYGYVTDELSVVFGVPAGWYPANVLMQAVGYTFAGVITNIMDDPEDGKFRLLLSYEVYYHKDGWVSVKSIGRAGTGASAEAFNHPSNIASGQASHAEGFQTCAQGFGSHAEGSNTYAEGSYSHAEGVDTYAQGSYSHAEGDSTHAEGDSSHAEGDNTHAEAFCQHVQGTYNLPDTTSAHIVGNGDDYHRSNAHTLDWDGNAWYAGDVYVGSTSGTNMDGGSVRLAKTTELPTKTSQLTNDSGFVTADNIPNPVTIVQGPGESESQVMSQKAVTDLVNDALGDTETVEYETVDSVEEMTDTSKGYVLSSTGTIWMYREETVEVAPPNKFDPSTATLNARLSGSSASVTAGNGPGSFTTDFIAVSDMDSITPFQARLNFEMYPHEDNKIVYFNSSKTRLGNNVFVPTTTNHETLNGETILDFKSIQGTGSTEPAWANVAYVRLQLFLKPQTTTLTASDIADVTITFDHEGGTETIAEWYDTQMTPSSAGAGGNYVTLAVQVEQNKTDISEVSRRVTVLESGSNTVTVPSFWEDAVKACISKIKALQVGIDCVTFPFFTDNHQRNGYSGEYSRS